MTTLGGITLSDHLILTGLLSSPAVATATTWSIGGVPTYTIQPLSGGRSLVLQGENHYTLEQLEQIRAMSNLGESVSLDHPQFTGDVYITGIDSPEPIFDRADPESDWLYSANINLREK